MPGFIVIISRDPDSSLGEVHLVNEARCREIFLYSGGFMLSGVNDIGNMWVNGVLSEFRTEDYGAGNASWDIIIAHGFLVRRSSDLFRSEDGIRGFKCQKN